jgi:hypothetical protein
MRTGPKKKLSGQSARTVPVKHPKTGGKAPRKEFAQKVPKGSKNPRTQVN